MDLTAIGTILYGIWLFIVANAPMLSGFILPPFIDVINKEVTSEVQKFIIALFVCALVSLVVKWNSLAYGDPEAVLATTTLIFAQSQLVYRVYFKDSFIRAKMKQKLNFPVLETK